MTIVSSGCNVTTIRKLASNMDNAVRLVRRVANRHHCLKEANLNRLVNAFVLCQFSYVAAMHNWQRAERDKLNVLLRKITKRAEHLLQLAVHNTLEKIPEAHERAQVAPFSFSEAGRHILREVGHSPAQVSDKLRRMPREIRTIVSMALIPRNIHPEHNRDK